MRTMLTRFRDCSLSIKIIGLFAFVLCISILTAYMVFQTEHDQLRYAEFDSMARQNAQLIGSSIDAMLDNVNHVSKMLLSNDNIQSILIRKESFDSPRVMRTLRTLLSSTANLQPHAAALYLFDTSGQKFGVDNYTMQRFSFLKVEEAAWYPALFDQKGYYLLLLNGGEQHALYGNENVISFVRNIYNLNEQSELLGTLMLNLRESFVTTCFAEAKGTTDLMVAVVDENGQSILSSDSGTLSVLSKENQETLLHSGRISSLMVHGKKPHIYSSVQLRNAPWRVITALPYTGSVRTLAGMEYVFKLLILLIVPLIFVATLIITRMVTRPLHQMAKGMFLSGNDRPSRLPIRGSHDEIGLLTNAYNHMADQIEGLLARIHAESERKRQAEFHALQAQINPHFLYNTIDTLRALALSGRTREVNDLLRSLGEFYRNSINNGKSIITIGEEISMVKSYMAIQSARFFDITTEFMVDDGVCKAPIPKLILQPLVENALYHGLRSAGHKGIIRVEAFEKEGWIFLCVSDNGVGISPEEIEKATNTDINGDAGRFGLRGTIDRIRLFYGQSDPVTIQGHQGKGTTITIKIPLEGGANYGTNQDAVCG